MNQTSISENRAGVVGLGIVIFWAGFVLFKYFFYPTHPLGSVLPFFGEIFNTSSFPLASSDQFWETQVVSLKILFFTLMVSIVTWSLGWRIRLWLNIALADSWIRFAIDFGLGICALNFFWIGTGFERIWFKPVWVVVGTGLFLLSLWDFWTVLRMSSGKGFKVLFPKEFSYFFLLLIGLFYLGFSFLQNLAPETFYDSMVYHLAVPQYWLLNHGLRDFPTNFFSNYPFGGEAFFLNGLVFQGTEAAKMLHAVSFGVCALLAGGWAREITGEKAGWLTLGLALTLPLFAVNTWTSEVEGILSLAVVLFLYSFYRFAQEPGKARWGYLAGLFLGLALSIKYTAVLPAGIGFLVLVLQKSQAFRKEKWGGWGAIVLGVLLLLGPWLLKNLAYTGNPFFPYLMEHFAGRHLPLGGYEKLLEEQHARVTTTWTDWLLLPWTLSMANPDSYNFCGPLALALAPFLFLFRLRHPALRFLALVVPLFLVAGFGFTHILRFVLPDFVLLYILLGGILAGGDKPLWGRVAAWGGGVTAILCFAFLAAISHYYYNAAGIWSGRQTREAYLSGPGKITPYYGLAQWTSTHLPSDARLLVVGDARGLYYDRPFLTNTVFDDQALAKFAKEEKDTEGIRRRLREMGVDALVVNGDEGIRVSAGYHHYDLTEEEWKRLDDFIQRGTEKMNYGIFKDVYRLLPSLNKNSPSDETFDVMLFFSEPASRFVLDSQRQKWLEAEKDLNEALELYPFSKTWIKQKQDFNKAIGVHLHG